MFSSQIPIPQLSGEPFIRLSGPLNQPEIRMGRSAAVIFPESSNDLERIEELNSKAYEAQVLFNDSSQQFSRAVSQVRKSFLVFGWDYQGNDGWIE